MDLWTLCPDVLNVVISHRYVNSRRPLGRDGPGLSIMTANIQTLSLDWQKCKFCNHPRIQPGIWTWDLYSYSGIHCISCNL